jgi:hypothetical protein
MTAKRHTPAKRRATEKAARPLANLSENLSAVWARGTDAPESTNALLRVVAFRPADAKISPTFKRPLNH